MNEFNSIAIFRKVRVEINKSSRWLGH